MRKRNLVLKILFNKKTVLAWDFFYLNKIKNEITPFIKIKIKIYKVWQVTVFRILKALKNKIVAILKNRLNIKILKYYNELYRNP